MIANFAFTNCKKKTTEPVPEPGPTPTGPTYAIPSTYSFSIVNYNGQTTRLDMVSEMKTYMNTGNTMGTVLNAQKLKDMYQNINNQFTSSSLNTSGKDIKSKVFLPDQNAYESFIDSLVASSTSTVAGSNGMAGVIVSTSNSTKKYLFDKNGIEWIQVIEKGLMGSLMYYQTTAVYLDAAKIGNGVDNTTIVAGEGTAMEHGWDEAFGYFGVPVDFPANTTGIRFWGKYCNDRNAVLGINATLMNAFIKGRAAISNKDYATRDTQVTIIRDTWEKVIASTIISYVNSTKLNLTDDAIRNHNLSEVKGIIMNFRCNPTKKISASQITQLENLLGNNFYNITTSNLDQIRDLLAPIYGLESVKTSL